MSAADHFLDQCGCHPTNNFNACVSGEPGVYPIGNPIEVHNKIVKGKVTDVAKNASLGTFLAHTAQTLLKRDALERCDPCTVNYPSFSSKGMTAITGFMKIGTDLVEAAGVGWISNLRWNIGVPLDTARIKRIFSAYVGVTSIFKEDLINKTELDLAFKIISVTNGVCLLRLNVDGVVAGNCDNCMKNLGCECEAATLLRDHLSHLRCPLSTLIKVPADARGGVHKAVHSGNLDNVCFSGHSLDGRTQREVRPALTSFNDYLASLWDDQIASAVQHLGLLVWDGVGAKPNCSRMKREESLRIARSFLSDRMATRVLNKAKHKNCIRAKGLSADSEVGTKRKLIEV